MKILPSRDGSFVEPLPPKRFHFEANNRQRFPVVPEKRGNGVYWYMRKKIGGRQHGLYLAPQGKLELEMLKNAAEQISDAAAHHADVKRAQIAMPFMRVQSWK